ncbi:Uncharacterised protein [Mycobacterium tuberculosis]|nr:Uncharacterised protein [Mycobacterium tuberculosis]COZ06467.1 Uncharacterised protein [Mycobacterium tuberculosis]
MPAPMGVAPLNCVKASSNWHNPVRRVLSNSRSGGASGERGPSTFGLMSPGFVCAKAAMKSGWPAR